ncbi:DNA translocase FtsK [Neisseria lactamica]|uniref:Putative cell-division protein n=1 Tax=Neisseria lactamica (strain 020-06) TaxID=489653 RepID=E4ZCU6_NEIL0|nr:DNA translocase FtsK [Neisseria lactamica]CBN87179.1 putative cell-division protein [Neisseria lactamica 020-06]
MFWIVLIVILLLALAGLFVVRARSEREWVRELAERQEGGGRAELPEIKDGMPDFSELALMLVRAVKAMVCCLSDGIVRFCRNYLAHESEPDRPAPSDDGDGASGAPEFRDEAGDKADEAVGCAPQERTDGGEDIETAIIGNRSICSDRENGIPMPSESGYPPVRPVVQTFQEITLEEAKRALNNALAAARKEQYIGTFEKNGMAAPKVRVSDTPMEGLPIIGLDDPVLQRARAFVSDADKSPEPSDDAFEPYFERAPRGESVSDGIAGVRRVPINLKEPNKATVSAEARISRLIPEHKAANAARFGGLPSEPENAADEARPAGDTDEAADVRIVKPAAPDAWVVEPPEVPAVAVPEIDILPPPPVSEIYGRDDDLPEGFEQAYGRRLAEIARLACDTPEGGLQDGEAGNLSDEKGEEQAGCERNEDEDGGGGGQYLSDGGASRYRGTDAAMPSEPPSCRASDTEADEGAFQSEETGAVSEHLPTTDLLLPPLFNPEATQTEEELLENSITIEEKLAEFKVKVKVVDSYSGPVITRYEIEPDVGVRGNSVLNLEKDLARSLGVASIRVVETIPGKTCMGLELPNPKRQMIRLSEIFNSPEFAGSKSKLTLALGQDITGQPVVTDLGKAPHLLVAGTTGSGKSVGVNAMILSMLFKAAPEDVRMIMIDPKMLELSIYEGIPHLLAPVVTDMKLAANALNWCVNEMEKRYRLMSFMGVRNLAGFNQKIAEAAARGEKIGNPFSLTPDDPEPLEKLPFIVVVVDEFADLMMTAGKKIEELIARLAQKARAAGIHLILATQRPSVDVITGLIKANIPTRIAFQVSSKIDSRTILDQMGAENLLGQGDMLFLPPGTAYPQRVHGAFASDEEVHRVVEYLKQFGEPDYVDDILSGGMSDDLPGIGRSGDGETDPMYDEAVSVVLKTRKASISGVQRALRIGYNRAARLIDQMEAEGIVSAPEHNGNRTILVPLDNA